MGAVEQMRAQQQVRYPCFHCFWENASFSSCFTYSSFQMTLQDQSDTYAQARSNAMETIEGSISELGQIFAQLASLVSEQGEMITRCAVIYHSTCFHSGDFMTTLVSSIITVFISQSAPALMQRHTKSAASGVHYFYLCFIEIPFVLH